MLPLTDVHRATRCCDDSTLELLLYSAEGTVIMPSMSPPSSGTVASLVGGLESVARLTPPPGTPPSSPSPSAPRASLALRFLRERSFPMGPGLYSLVSTGSISGSCQDCKSEVAMSARNNWKTETAATRERTYLLCFDWAGSRLLLSLFFGRR